MAGEVPAAWLEAGGFALWGRLYGKDQPPGFSARLWEDTTEEVRERFRNHALDAITAVAPLIRAAECRAPRARVAELEGVALGALAAISGVLAWHLTPEQYHKMGLHPDGAKQAWADARAVAEQIRAALKGAKP